MSQVLTVDHEPGPPATSKVRIPPTRTGKEIAGKRKIALDGMVWKGLDWKTAAEEAGLKPDALRKAIEQPHVRQYLNQQRQVFRESARAQNIHSAVDVRDQKVNQTARIQAIRYLDGISEQEAARDAGRSVVPGVVVTVNVQRAPHEVDETVIEVGAGAYTASEAADNDPQT